jgi:hypothetical protein
MYEREKHMKRKDMSGLSLEGLSWGGSLLRKRSQEFLVKLRIDVILHVNEFDY